MSQISNEIPPAIQERIKYLQESYEAHLEAANLLMEADGGRLFGVDFVVFAVLQRSLSLMEGFTLLIKQRNLVCAAALLRLQIDSLMRLYACWLVEEPHSVINTLLEGKSLKKMKSRTSQPLTDRYLRTELAKGYPWVSRVYEACSGFIHLSSPHVLSVLKGNPAGGLEFRMGKNVPQWSESQILELVEAFVAATETLFHLSGSWHATKERGAESRQGRSKDTSSVSPKEEQ